MDGWMEPTPVMTPGNPRAPVGAKSVAWYCAGPEIVELLGELFLFGFILVSDNHPFLMS